MELLDILNPSQNYDTIQSGFTANTVGVLTPEAKQHEATKRVIPGSFEGDASKRTASTKIPGPHRAR